MITVITMGHIDITTDVGDSFGLWHHNVTQFTKYDFYFGFVLESNKIIRLRKGLLIEHLCGTISNNAPRGKQGTTKSKLELLVSELNSSLVTNPNWTRSNSSKSLLLLSSSPPSMFVVIASRCDTANMLWLRDPQPKIKSYQLTSSISNQNWMKISIWDTGVLDRVRFRDFANKTVVKKFCVT